MNAYAAGTDRYHVGCAVAEYLAAFDAARSRPPDCGDHYVAGYKAALAARPATDPAGLDVERRALVEDAVKTAASIGLHFPALCHAFGIDDTVGPAIDLARLSVVDRPGPS